jgi:AraC-like DNA-binding protein
LAGCEIVVGAFSDLKLARHSHDALMLSLIDQGAQRVRYRGADHIGAPGQVVAVPPHGVHSGEAGDSAGWRYRVLMVDLPLLMTHSPDIGEGFACETIVSDQQLRLAMDQFFAACDYEGTLELEARLNGVLRLFRQRHVRAAYPTVSAGREARAVDQAKAFLRAHLGVNVSLRELAEAAVLEPHRLIRAFTAAVGLPPHAWHKQMRIRDAQTRLIRGEAVAEVAYATGFADQAHFTRVFRAVTGVTPARYRRAHRLGSGSLRCRAISQSPGLSATSLISL